ncbi:MAG: hypothetical protein K2I06_14145 [Ruminococcus sp.]|nr:hypothetical protein [Ruminococcus sp.]
MKYFWVNQNKTYDIESKFEFLWAPIFNKRNRKEFHWETMLNVMKGDIIFHYSNGKICSISIAKDKCYNCSLPDEMHDFSDEWEKDGRRLNSEYHTLNTPMCIKDSAYIDDILKLNRTLKHSPFNKNGRVNQGYLFQLNEEMAKYLLEKIGEINDLSFLD